MNTAEAAKYEEQSQEDRGLFILTHTNKLFYAMDPRPEDIDIEDIAHALALTCRFSGHCSDYYSVAQHSVIVSHLVPPEHALAGLLHDAPEAYVTDIPRPIKHMFNEKTGGLFSEVEDQIYAVIAEKYGLPSPFVPQDVHAIDHNVVADEAMVLFHPVPEWVNWYEPLGIVVKPVGWRQAKKMFMDRFEELTNGNG